MRFAACIATMFLGAANAAAQQIGQVERATDRGSRYEILVLSVPFTVDSALVRVRRALADQLLAVRRATDSLIEAGKTENGFCKSSDGKVPFAIGDRRNMRAECRLQVSVRMAKDSIGTLLRLTGTESQDEPSRVMYRLVRSSPSWKVLQNVARAVADTAGARP